MKIHELSSKVIKCGSRKICVWCGRSIKPMQKAVFRVGCYEGNFRSEFWHPECYEVAPMEEK